MMAKKKRGEVIPGSSWALVTGAGSGIGRQYALRLAELGYNLAIVGDKEGPLHETEQMLREHGCRRTHIEQLDLARLEAADELCERLTLHDIHPDVVVNNAGIFSFLDITETDEGRIEKMILLHDVTNTKICRHYAREMIQRGVKGHILNMSSYSLWMPFPGMALYSASKAYLRQFSVCFAKEVREHGITVTAVCPAGVATDLYGLSHYWQGIGCKLGVLITPDNCARRGLRALWRGKRTCVPDWWNRAWIPLCKLLPMCIIRPIRRRTMQFQK